MAIAIESTDEVRLLLRSLRSEIFRLIVVQHNHRQVVDVVTEQIVRTYTGRRINRVTVAHKTYRELMETIYQQGNGVLVIEDFQYVLRDPKVYVAFNQRRDKIAQYPLALICFITVGNEVLHEFIKKLPDLWSFRSLMIEIVRESDTFEVAPESIPTSTLGGKTIQKKERELNRLITRINELPDDADHTALLITYYPQILQLLEETGAYRRGLDYAEQFIQLLKTSTQSEPLPDDYPDALNWKAKFCKHLGDYQQAETLMKGALALDTAKYGESHPYATTRQSGLATIYQELGNYPKAKELLEQALASDINHYGKLHASVAAKQANLAAVYQELGDYKKAQELLEEALHYGLSHQKEGRTVAERMSSLALVYQAANNPYRAKHLLEQALALNTENYGDDHPVVAAQQSNMASVYRSLGEYEKARDLLEQSLSFAKKHYEAEHAKVLLRKSNLALVYLDLKEYEKARDLLEEALIAAKTNYGSEHDMVAKIKSNLGVAYDGLGQYNKAAEQWKQAYRIFSNTRGREHPHTRETERKLKYIKDRKKKAKSRRRY